MSVKGARRKATSFRTSTKTPPRPNITMGPNCGSVAMPVTSSRFDFTIS